MVVYIDDGFSVLEYAFQIAAAGSVGTFQQNNGVKIGLFGQGIHMNLL